MNVYVFHVDGGGESFERVVVKAMKRCEKAQIFRDTLRQGLAQSMVLDRQAPRNC